MKLIYKHILTLVILSFIACEKDELPVTLPQKPVDVKLMSIDLGEQYTKQVFVNLTDGRTWECESDDWDLQFESSAEGKKIMMNGGKGVLLASTGKRTFYPCNTANLAWRWDEASGIFDSLVLSSCFNRVHNRYEDSVYVIDRGASATADQRYIQFQIHDVTSSYYVINSAKLDGTSIKTDTIYKDHTKVHVYYTFENGGRNLNIEPPKSDWHFCLLRYRWVYYEYNPPLLYSVVGAHINTHLVDVAVDSTLNFNEIHAGIVQPMPFHTRRDVIGFEWKYPDFTPGGVKYISRPYWNFIIREKTGSNIMYKMRFIDFYNDMGVKGTPRFEFQRIH